MKKYKGWINPILEKVFTFLTVREIQVSSLLTFRDFLVNMPMVQKADDNIYVKDMDKEGLLIVRNELVQLPWKSITWFSQNKQTNKQKPTNQPAIKNQLQMAITWPLYSFSVSKHTTAILTGPFLLMHDLLQSRNGTIQDIQ